MNSCRAIPVSAIEQRRPSYAIVSQTPTEGLGSKVALLPNQANSIAERSEPSQAALRDCKPCCSVQPSAVSTSARIRSIKPASARSLSITIAVNLLRLRSKERISSSRFGPTVMPTIRRQFGPKSVIGRNPTPTSFLSEHNQVMSKWLELQIRQVQANEQFLRSARGVIS